MTVSKNKRKRGETYIFKGRRSNKSILKQTSEALIMLIIGANLAFFLNTLPSGFLFDRLSKDIWIELYEKLYQTLLLLIHIGGGVIIIGLLITSLVLIAGGCWRLILIYKRYNYSKKKNGNGP